MSEGLESFVKLRKSLSEIFDISEGTNDNLEIIEKELKALEIIKEKKVDVKYLCYRAEFNVEKYNDNYVETLTQEECDLLREVLL